MKHPVTALLRDNPCNNLFSFVLESEFTTVPMGSAHFVFQQFAHLIPYNLGHPHSVYCVGSQAEQGLSKSLSHGAENRDSPWPLTVLRHLKASQQQAKCSAVEKSRKLEMPCRNSSPDARLVISLMGLQKTVGNQREKHCQSSSHPVLTCPLSTVSLCSFLGRQDRK